MGQYPELAQKYDVWWCRVSSDDRTLFSDLADTIAADPNASDAECKTALHWATEAGDVGSARALLAAGADKDAKSNVATTALKCLAHHCVRLASPRQGAIL